VSSAPNANNVGPFLSIEQAAGYRSVPEERRAMVFACYNLDVPLYRRRVSVATSQDH